MTDSVLTTSHLSKQYGSGSARFDALTDVTLDIKAGATVAIVGKSGSGKSTLMHILALLDGPTTGELWVDGTDASKLKGRRLNELRNRTFGFVFQQFFLTPNTTVLDNVMLPLKIARVGGRERKRRAMEELEMLELGDKAKSKATDLSGGQKQRLAIARALATNPPLLLLDDPLSAVDAGREEEILDELRQFYGDRTVLIVSQRISAFRDCDRVIVLKNGTIAEEGHHGFAFLAKPYSAEQVCQLLGKVLGA